MYYCMIAKSKLLLCEYYIKPFKNVDDKLSFNCTVGLLIIMLVQIYDDTSLHTNSRSDISSQMNKYGLEINVWYITIITVHGLSS